MEEFLTFILKWYSTPMYLWSFETLTSCLCFVFLLLIILSIPSGIYIAIMEYKDKQKN